MRASFSFEPEFAGDDESIRVQARILNEDSWISANTGVISRATRVTVLDAWRRTEDSMIEIARKFESAAFILHPHQRAALDRISKVLASTLLHCCISRPASKRSTGPIQSPRRTYRCSVA